MADNVPITAGSGTSIATDEVGSDHYQKMKVYDGTANSSNALVVDSSGRITVINAANSTVSTANSSTANLAGGAAFTGTSEDISEYASIRISVYSSHASATNGLSLQQSSDGTNWDITDTYTVSATTACQINLAPSARYFRLVYTNGATLTTSLRIQTIFHKNQTTDSSQRPADARTNETDMTEGLSYGMVFNGTTWDRTREAVNALNSTGTGIVASNIVAQFDDTSPQTVTENQFGNLRMSAKGVLYGTIRDAAGNERGANVNASNQLSVSVDAVAATNISTNVAQIGGTTVVNGGVAGSLAIGGTTAAGSSVANNPVQLGGRAITANPTAVTDGQVSRITTDKVGRLVVVQGQARDLVAVQTTTITASTSETTIVTAAASTFHDLTSLSITNSSSTATLVTLKDATAGTTRAIWSLQGYAGIVLNFNPPMPQASANNNWTITCGSSVSSLYVNAVYVKNI